MRTLVVAILMLATGLAGCTSDDGPTPVFECTNSTWIKAPGKSSARGIFYRNNSLEEGQLGYGTSSYFDNPHLGTVGKTFHDGTLDVFMFTIESYSSVDVTARIKASTAKHLEGPNYTADRPLFFQDVGNGGGYLQQIVLPAGLQNHSAVYRIELTDGTTFNPEWLLIEWDYTPNTDGDDSTDSAARWDTKVEYWYRTCTVT